MPNITCSAVTAAAALHLSVTLLCDGFSLPHFGSISERALIITLHFPGDGVRG
jgi:hypothetical protein